MLVKFYTVESDANQSISTAMSLFGNNIPTPTCLSFSNIASKYVICIDASIDAEPILSQNGFSSVFVQDSDVPIESYSNKYSIGVNFNPMAYYLYKKKLPMCDLSGNPFPICDMSGNLLP